MVGSRRQFIKTTLVVAAGSLFPGGVAYSQNLKSLGDVVVLIPGIMGSVLQKNGHDVWALSGPALANGLKTLGESVAELTLRGDSPTTEILGDGVVASRIFPDTHLLPGLWKIDGYSGISKAITDTFDASPGRNYFDFPYDWRRDNRAAARRLQRLASGWLGNWRQTSGNRNAKLILVAHSMGGLVARYFLEVLGGWRDTRMLITFGTPYRGSLNALNFLANGYKKQFGPVTLVDISSLVRSFTSVYQLLPIYPCVDPGTGVLRRVVEINSIPNVDRGRAQAALNFHNEMREANERNVRQSDYIDRGYSLHPVVGTYQPTLQIGRLAGTGLQMFDRHPQAPDVQGDGTVPETSATPIEPDILTKQHIPVYVSEIHGSLQNSAPMLDHVRAVITARGTPQDLFREAVNRVAMRLDDLYSTNDDVTFQVGCEDLIAGLTVVLSDAASNGEIRRLTVGGNGATMRTVQVGRLPEGTYRVHAFGGAGVGSATDTFVVIRA